jgi:site-specific DNA recombinase
MFSTTFSVGNRSLTPDCQKGLDFRREESVCVLAGVPRILRRRASSPGDRAVPGLASVRETTKTFRRDAASHSCLAGKIYDDRGNRMTPSHAAKGARRWRYYVSQAALKGRRQDAGSVMRVPAAEIERKVLEAITPILQSQELRAPGRVLAGVEVLDESNPGQTASCHPRATVGALPEQSHEVWRGAIERVTVGAKEVEIRLNDALAIESQDRLVTIPWTRPSPRVRRQIIEVEGERSSTARPMRVRERHGFLEAVRRAHRWLDELTRDTGATIESLAIREGRSERSIRQTLSLAFVAPPILAAAIDGRLPRGFGVTRLMDLPMAWSAH